MPLPKEQISNWNGVSGTGEHSHSFIHSFIPFNNLRIKDCVEIFAKDFHKTMFSPKARMVKFQAEWQIIT